MNCFVKDFLGIRAVFGDLGTDETFRGEFLEARETIARDGMHAALDAYLA